VQFALQPAWQAGTSSSPRCLPAWTSQLIFRWVILATSSKAVPRSTPSSTLFEISLEHHRYWKTSIPQKAKIYPHQSNVNLCVCPSSSQATYSHTLLENCNIQPSLCTVHILSTGFSPSFFNSLGICQSLSNQKCNPQGYLAFLSSASCGVGKAITWTSSKECSCHAPRTEKGNEKFEALGTCALLLGLVLISL
jgi:hypothetical protein